MPAEPMTEPGDRTIVLRLQRVSKVFCERLDQARRYAMRDLFTFGRRNRVAKPRPGEWSVLSDISLTVNRGETVAVLGTAESGKTTLAGIACGLLHADDGVVERHGSVGIVGTGKYGLSPYLTVREYVRLMTALQGVAPANAREVCEHVLEWAGLADQRGRMVVDLPRQVLTQLSLAASLMVEHDFYVFDDFAPLHEEMDERFAQRAAQILEKGTSLVLADHTKLPAKLDQVVLLHAGQVLYAGRPDIAVPLFERFNAIARRSAAQARVTAPPGTRLRRGLTADDGRALVAQLVQGAQGSALVAGIEDELLRLATERRAVLAGPFLADSGFEVLYWRPFLRWIRERYLAADQRLVAISSGRMDAWYSGLADSYLDIADLMQFAEFRAKDAERVQHAGSVKQTRVTALDEQLLSAAAGAERLGGAGRVHPSLLFNFCAEVWRGRVPLPDLIARLRFTLPDARHRRRRDLPDTYFVVTPEFTSYFPDTPAHRDLLTGMVHTLERLAPVIVIGGHAWLADASQSAAGTVRIEDPASDPAARMRVQSDILAGARGVAGVFNSTTQMAVCLGVPVLALSASTSGLMDVHLAVVSHAATSLGEAPFVHRLAADFTDDAVTQWCAEFPDVSRGSIRAR